MSSGTYCGNPAKCILLAVEGETPIEMPACKIFLDGYEGWLNTSYINPSYLDKTVNKPIDCMWTVNVTEGWKVSAAFFIICSLFNDAFSVTQAT
jgi:hypothetical protein